MLTGNSCILELYFLFIVFYIIAQITVNTAKRQLTNIFSPVMSFVTETIFSQFKHDDQTNTH